MTKYLIIREPNEYVSLAPDGSWTWTTDISKSTEFDSMTVAELFAATKNLERYKVVPVKARDNYDLGGEG